MKWYVCSRIIVRIEISMMNSKNMNNPIPINRDGPQPISRITLSFPASGLAQHMPDMRQLLTQDFSRHFALGSSEPGWLSLKSFYKGMLVLRVAQIFQSLFRDDYTTRKAFLILNYHVESVSTSFSLV